MAEAFIIDACRTPRGIGKQGKGALAHLHPQHLASTVLKALVDRNGFDTADVDDVIWGRARRSVSRAAISAAWRHSTPATTCARAA